MKDKKNARRGECLGNKHHDERIKDSRAARLDSNASADAQAVQLARSWRVGKERVWSWWVGRLQERLASGNGYASMRNFTDDAGQNHDFVDDDGRKVSVPHNKGLGRGIALLMVAEHPEFRPLFRMKGASFDVR